MNDPSSMNFLRKLMFQVRAISMILPDRHSIRIQFAFNSHSIRILVASHPARILPASCPHLARIPMANLDTLALFCQTTQDI
jgi:hypothetical protein